MNLAYLSLSPHPKPELRACSLSWSSAQQARASSRLEEHMSCQVFYSKREAGLSPAHRKPMSPVWNLHSSPQKHSWRLCRPLLLAECPMARQTPFLWSLHLGPGVFLDVFAREDFSCILPPEGSTEGFLYAGLLTGSDLEKGEAAAALGIIRILKKI